MIGYTCKYTPLELLAAFGAEPVLMDREEPDFQEAEALTHTNLCCHAKSIIQQGTSQEELILVDCCDAIRRTYDVMEREGRQSLLYLMDLPHTEGPCTRSRLREELLRIAEVCRKFYGTEFSKSAFLDACCGNSQTHPERPFLAVLGARISPPLLSLIQDRLPFPVVNLTCSGNRWLESPPEGAEQMSFGELMDWYAGALLNMVPCMRMKDVSNRKILTEHPLLRGIVYNTVKFCDFYGFDYAELKRNASVPILKIESDYMPQPAGQLSTRLEAFAESLLAGRDPETDLRIEKTPGKTALYAGIDSGSTTTNIVVIDQEKNMLAYSIVRTGAKAQNGARAALEDVCRKLSVQPDAFSAILATGYGRNNIPFATDTKTEITCHAKGGYFLSPETRTIVDIGGQDSKVICMDPSGAVINFIMNDKCAAGTGRFLEMMARSLELDLEEMSRKGMNWKKDLTISSMCTVFAESEVISLIADNHSDSDIIHGLNKSVASKTASMVSRAKGAPPYMMTGGVARNKGVVRELEKRLGSPMLVTENPDLCGALGAALFALEGAEQEEPSSCGSQ